MVKIKKGNRVGMRPNMAACGKELLYFCKYHCYKGAALNDFCEIYGRYKKNVKNGN